MDWETLVRYSSSLRLFFATTRILSQEREFDALNGWALKEINDRKSLSRKKLVHFFPYVILF